MAVVIGAVSKAFTWRVTYYALANYLVLRVVGVEAHDYTAVKNIQFTHEVLVGVLFHVGNYSTVKLIDVSKSIFQ